MLKHLELSCENDEYPVYEATKFLQAGLKKNKSFLKHVKDGELPIKFIKPKDRELLKTKTGEYDKSKYELNLYFAISKAINKGRIHCNESIRHKSLKADLIDDATWANKEELIKNFGYKNITLDCGKRLDELEQRLHEKILRVNERISSGDNQYFVQEDNGQWHLKYQSISDEVNHKFFTKVKKRSIIEIMHFVNEATNFTEAFTHLRTRYVKQSQDDSYLIATILANGLNFGTYQMSQTCDVDGDTLERYEKNYLRVETLKEANDRIVNKIGKLGIYKEWHLLVDKLLGSADGSKYESKYHTIQSRFSPKYFGLKKGIVAYNLLVNNAIINSQVISPNEHESHFLFDIVFNNTSEIEPDAVTGDMHSINCLNYVLLDGINKEFMPNFNNAQSETLSSLKSLSNYESCIVKPTNVVNRKLIEEEWDNIQRVQVSLVMGQTTQSIIVGKLSSSKRNTRLKRAFKNYNDILKSLHLLEFIDDNLQRSSIRGALNRVENYHKLRRAISRVGGGKFSGKSPVENEIWNQSTRLIANCIIYYNAMLLDKTISEIKGEIDNEEYLRYIKSISPISWVNVNLTGKYEFTGHKMGIDIQNIVQQLKEEIYEKNLFK